MNATLLRIGNTTINLATITQIIDGTASDDLCVYFSGPSEGAYCSFHGDERAALLDWLKTNSTDVLQLVAQRQNVRDANARADGRLPYQRLS